MFPATGITNTQQVMTVAHSPMAASKPSNSTLSSCLLLLVTVLTMKCGPKTIALLVCSHRDTALECSHQSTSLSTARPLGCQLSSKLFGHGLHALLAPEKQVGWSSEEESSASTPSPHQASISTFFRFCFRNQHTHPRRRHRCLSLKQPTASPHPSEGRQ